MRIRLIITGRSYEMNPTFPRALEVRPGAQVDDALASAARACVPLAPRALLAVSGAHIGTVADHEPRPLVEDDELLVFAPVAGG